MSQVIFDEIDPTISGDTLADTLNNFKDALMSGLSGTSRPTELQAGGAWIDTTNDPTSWTYKVFTGTTDIAVFTLNLTSGVAAGSVAVDSFSVKKVSADTAGAILALIKNRIATNGQVLNGDIVGEIRVVGRTATSTNPVVAKIIFTATDDMTTSVYGGTLSFMSTPDATNTLTEHMRFINGLVETTVPLKVNSEILVGQNVATSATIVQLSASKILVEMTGSTATDIQGINSANDTQFITVHNRSTAIVTLKHQNATAAAADRLKLPNSVDYLIPPDSTATLYYCSTDTKWKLVATAQTSNGFSLNKYYGGPQTWTAPTTTTAVAIRAYSAQNGTLTGRNNMTDAYGSAYAWGVNANGQLGVGDVIPRSSPVAVLEALTFSGRIHGASGAGANVYGVTNTGAAFAWGVNTNGQIGNGGVVPQSSPVAVLGGLRFNGLTARDASVFGIVTSNLAYAWGVNVNGQLGLGDVNPRSSPVAVLSAQKYQKIVAASGANTNLAVLGLNTAGSAFAWGINTDGNLGDGTVVPKSSPTAVLGSLTFVHVGVGAVSSRYFSVALNQSGAAYAWGNNTQSQLGVGDQTPRSSPVAVVGGLTFVKLITHEKSETVMGLTSTGALYAWGDNTQGVLGVGDNLNKSSPVAVLGGLSFTSVKLFKSMAIGITADGTAYAWGKNDSGQLGVGDQTSRSSPVAVLGGLKFVEAVMADGPTDDYSVYGMTPDGQLYSWGSNTNGTLGLGDTTKRSSPIAVLGAFGPDSREDVSTTYLTVVPGASYNIGMGEGNASFGAISIGRDIYKVEVEYVQ